MKNCFELKKNTIETPIEVEGFGSVLLIQRPLTSKEKTIAQMMKPNPLEVPVIFKYIFDKRKIEEEIEAINDQYQFIELSKEELKTLKGAELIKRREEIDKENISIISKADQKKIDIKYKEIFGLEGKAEYAGFVKDNAPKYYDHTVYVVKHSLTNHVYFGGGIECETDLSIDLLIDILEPSELSKLQAKASSLSSLSVGERNEVK